MSKIKVAAVQMQCSSDRSENIAKAEAMVRLAHEKGAQIILLPELFETPYFCQERNYDYYKEAFPTDENPAVKHFKKIAGELSVVLPISFYEKSGNTYFNTVAVIDADGTLLGTYRKSHIPDDHFYQEKFYFSPGDTGFRTWNTKYASIGVGICWDQWFPEAARCMALKGADILLYPTAIGSEPILDCDSCAHWQRVMQGHAAANITPVVAANRIGLEKVTPSKDNGGQESSLVFYGSSFITDETGAITAKAGRDSEEIVVSEIDLDAVREMRTGWGLFRDRRPELYAPIMKL